MPEAPKCPVCGAEMPVDSPGAQCVQCLLGLGLSGSGLGEALETSDPPLSATPERPGDRIGRYKLLQEIGEGGCGVVYMAEQEEPVRRRVALKVIKLGMDTKSVVARFEAERQALAMMDHPNIAKVLDAGATETGRPYFVMELVRGIKITDYCDQKNLSTRQRLDLFTQICQAIQHAHQKGVIHRDIKPSNILVTVNDGVPIPKVIDFGIAKATQGRLTDKTLFTAFEQFLGTPSYMSPEQAEMTSLDVDTRSDIYSLGVLLYELLTGNTPFDAKELLQAGLDEMRRKIREDEPARPSTRLSTMVSAELMAVAMRHAEDAPRFIKLIRGDLDWIVMKCLEKDRARRYETANGLAMDLQRHLNNEPVTAAGPSTFYRTQKLVRRHKVVLAVASSFAVLLLASVVVSTWLALRASHAETQQSRLRGEAQEAQKIEAGLRIQAVETGAQLQEALNRMEIQKAEELFVAGDSPGALAYLAHVLRQDAGNRVAAERALSALNVSRFAIDVVEPFRHHEGVRFAEFSPDGERIVTASWDKTARVWDAKTGQPITEPFKHGDRVNSAHFSPDGKAILTASDDKTARVWDSNTGQPITEPFKHEDRVLSARFSPDGKSVLTGSADMTARIWDANTGRPLTEPIRHENWVRSPRFSPDGTKIVTTDGTAHVWDAKTGQPLSEPLRDSWKVYSAEFSPDSQRIVTSSSHIARVWDANTGQPLTEPLKHENEIVSAQFSPDGERVVTASSDKTARVWDARTGRPLTGPLRHSDYVNSAEFSPDGLWIVTASSDHTVRIWDAETGHPLSESIKHGAGVMSAQFSPYGLSIVTASGDKMARVWDAKTGQPLTESLRHRYSVWSAQFSPDGQRIVTASLDGTARIWDAKTGRPLTAQLKHEDALFSAQFSPDGKRVVTASVDKTARVWDAKTGQPLTEPLRHNDEIYSAEFSPDGKRVVTASRDKTARVWDAITGQQVTEPLNHEAPVISASFSSDGACVVTASRDGTARVWDAKTGRPLTGPLKHEDGVFSAQFSPDGQRVVTASDDKTARVWDAKTGQPITEPLKHERAVSSARFSPDGERVVTASQDKSARVWNATTGQPLTEPLKQNEEVVSAQFSPDGTKIVTTGGTARVWDAKTGQPLSEPLMVQGFGLSSAQFSPDGQRVLIVSAENLARVWEVPTVSLPVPGWVPELLESVAAQRLNDQGILEPVAVTQIQTLQRQLSASTKRDVWTRWVKWRLSDPLTRTISPFSEITVPDYFQSLLKEETLESLRMAVRLMPTNGLTLARLARAVLAQAPEDNPRQNGEADWYSQRAVKLAPGEAESWWARAEALERAGKTSEALDKIKRALEIEPQRPEFWSAQGRMLETRNLKDEAYQSLTKAIELAKAHPSETDGILAKCYLSRFDFLKHEDRLHEAATDNCLARGIPPRDPQAGGNLIDLSPYYNVGLEESWGLTFGRSGYPTAGPSDLSELPRGIQTLSGVQFDLRGLIQVSSGFTDLKGYPTKVDNILIQRTCQRLHFLHATIYANANRNNRSSKIIGKYVINYANGGRVEIPIINGETLDDWFMLQDEVLGSALTIAWTGQNAESRREGTTIRLFKSTWQNPNPAEMIRSIDFISDPPGAPFLVAITADP